MILTPLLNKCYGNVSRMLAFKLACTELGIKMDFTVAGTGEYSHIGYNTIYDVVNTALRLPEHIVLMAFEDEMRGHETGFKMADHFSGMRISWAGVIQILSKPVLLSDEDIDKAMSLAVAGNNHWKSCFGEYSQCYYAHVTIHMPQQIKKLRDEARLPWVWASAATAEKAQAAAKQCLRNTVYGGGKKNSSQETQCMENLVAKQKEITRVTEIPKDLDTAMLATWNGDRRKKRKARVGKERSRGKCFWEWQSNEVEEKVDGFAPDSHISGIVSSVPFGEDHLDPLKSRLLVGGEWSREFDLVIGHDQASPEDFENDFRPPNAGSKIPLSTRMGTNPVPRSK